MRCLKDFQLKKAKRSPYDVILAYAIPSYNECFENNSTNVSLKHTRSKEPDKYVIEI